MTFNDIVQDLVDHLGLRGTAEQTRMGRAVNRHYKAVRAQCAMAPARRTDAPVVATAALGSQYLTFTGVEQLERVFDDSTGSIRDLDVKTVEEIRKKNPNLSGPREYAIWKVGAQSVTIITDCLAQSEFTLKADGWEVAETLSGSMEPAFPESFHQVLFHLVRAEELEKKEKLALSKNAEAKAAQILVDLQMYLFPEGLDIRQGDANTGSNGGTGAGSTGGSGAPSGGTSWTQTGLITFMRGLLAPFVVQSGSAKVDNLDSDKVDGMHAQEIIDAAAAEAGDVTGPASSTDNAIARYHLTTGKIIQDSGATIDDSGNLTANNISGTTSGANTGDVTLAGTPNYLTIVGQVITRALVNLASHVTGRLPYANLTAATAASKLFGRQSGSAGDWQEITLGTGLSMSGTTLSASSAPKPFLIFTAAANRPPASAFATPDTRNSHLILKFDGSTDEEAVFEGVLPTAYSGGGLTVDIYVAFTSATSGSVRFQAAIERIEASSLDIDADSFASFQSAGGTAPGTSGQVIVVSVAFTNGAQMDSLAAGDAFRLKLRRDADGSSGTDDITTDAEVLRVVVRES